MPPKDKIRLKLLSSGAAAAGFARAGKPDRDALNAFRRWIDSGMHAGMGYMERHSDLREDPALLLEGAETVISLAFPYAPETKRAAGMDIISTYAYGEDYHDVIRRRLKPVCREMETEYGCRTRICVDSAPVLERYWAMQSGIGRMGDNRCVIADGCGSLVFLAEILTTLKIEPDTVSRGECLHCGACIRACPTGALSAEGVDARLCLSYLTIEHRGDLPAMTELSDTLYGCDRCQSVCPYNQGIRPTGIEEFRPADHILHLTAEECAGMDESEFNELFRRSPIRRAGAAGLRRNALKILGSRRRH